MKSFSRLMDNHSGLSVDDPIHSTPNLSLEFTDALETFEQHLPAVKSQKSSKGSSLVTLKPFVADPLPQRRRKNVRVRNRENEREIIPGVFEPVNYNKFLTLKFDQDKRAQDLDMFTIEKQIANACGREPNITFQSDGSLLIEATTPEESLKLQGLDLIDGITAKCAPHRSLNQCKGVIRSPHLLKYSEERLLNEFASQKVVEVKQMKKFINNVLTPLPTYILTFDLIQLPQKLKAAWLRLQVRPYVPNPRRCFYCQRFGHVSNNCRRKLKDEKKVCDNCGQEEHGGCTRPSFCVNCSGSHPSSSKICDRFVLEREIQAIRAKENIPFPEAKRIVLSQFIRPGVTFASVLQRARKSSKPDVGKSTPKENQFVPKTIPPTKPNPKRRLSGEDEDNSPSFKSNRFELLEDQMDAKSVEGNDEVDNPVEFLPEVCSSNQMVDNVLSHFKVQPEFHAPPCSGEQEGTQAPVDLGELAGAVSLGGSVEPSEAPSLGGSVELPSLGGSGEPPGESALGGSGGPSGAVGLAGSLESVSADDPGEEVSLTGSSDFYENKPSSRDAVKKQSNIQTKSTAKKAKNEGNVKSPKKDKNQNPNKPPEPISNRRIRVPVKGPHKQSKNENKGTLNKTSEKGSSK